MERLTQRNEDGAARFPMSEGYEPPYPVVTQEAVDRLAAYEDTGMEPDKLKQLVDAIRKHEVVFLTKDRFMEKMLIKVDGKWADFTIAELQDFLRAKKEDRLIVLPCKLGEVVYKVKYHQPGCQWCLGDVNGTCRDCEGYDPQYAKVVTDTFSYDMIGRVGKTVFLTREEAEAAIKKEENHEPGN